MSLLTSAGAGARLTGSGHVRALRIFASSIARELKQRGYDHRHIVAVASELISLACKSIRSNHTPATGIDASNKTAQPPARVQLLR
jgi:hypothetical protein